MHNINVTRRVTHEVTPLQISNRRSTAVLLQTSLFNSSLNGAQSRPQSLSAHASRNERSGKLTLGARATFDCAGAKIFFVFSIFDDHADLCAVKSDKQKFKDKAFINRWSAGQIKPITAKSNSRLRQKILFDIDYESFAVGESLFVSRCRRSR